MNRREFLETSLSTSGAVAAGIVGAQSASGEGDAYDFLLPTVKFHCRRKREDRWNYYPGAVRNLLLEFRVCCSINNRACLNSLDILDTCAS